MTSVQVHIVDEDREFETLAAFTRAIPEMEQSGEGEEEIMLTVGGEMGVDQDSEMALYGDEQRQQIVIQNEGRAYGYFLHGVETRGGDIETAQEHLDLQPYVDFVEGLTERDRRMRLFDYADWRVENGDYITERYLNDEIKWRSGNLTESGERLAEEIARTCDIHTTMCYRTTQLAAIKHIDNHRVSYVEGLCLPQQAGQCIRHAWLEIDGEVAELTWPWHMFDGGEAVYLGVEFDKEEVKEARDRRQQNGAMILDDDEVGNMSVS